MPINSVLIFPPTSLSMQQALAWNNTKSPSFTTLVRQTAGGKEVRAMQQTFPRWRWVWEYKKIREDVNNELHEIMGFFLARHGSFEGFIIKDSEDYAFSNQIIGVGGGARLKWQLVRSYGQGYEPIYEVASTPPLVITVNGTTTAHTEVNGMITITGSTPTTGQIIRAASGEFYHRVRFSEDELDFENFMVKLWRLGQVEMVSA